MFSRTIALLALAASVSAHMILNYPVPFGNDTINNSPLTPSEYPCKQRPGVYDITKLNHWNAGETQTITFTGSAVHGGGSCQFSLSTDPEPTDKSQWKVIQSVVGGCPSNSSGNLFPEDAGSHRAAVFPVKMPHNIPDGRYTFAWTWINKEGHREFYMNCAPVQVGSASGTASTASVAAALSTLPDMFVINLPATQCSTVAKQDFIYPEPGQNLVKGKGANPGNSTEGTGCATQNKLGAGNGQTGTPTDPEVPAKPPAIIKQPIDSSPDYSAAPVASASPVEPAVPCKPGAVFDPGASFADAPQPTMPDGVESTVAPTPPSSAPTYGGAPTNGTPSGNGACTPCTNDGAVVCIGTNHFGLCNRGCAVAQNLAAGMACSNGAVVASAKRSLRFPRAHLHRRHGSARLH